MKVLLTVALLLFGFNNLQAQSNDALTDSLSTIFNFQFVDDNLASAGMPKDHQFGWIKDYGYTHVVNLIPGEFDKEEKILDSLGISFTQIQVDFRNPTLDDYDLMVEDFKAHNGEKILLHCAANMRASAFMFVYRTTELGVAIDEAEVLMNQIWDPHDGLRDPWINFVNSGLKRDGQNYDYLSRRN